MKIRLNLPSLLCIMFAALMLAASGCASGTWFPKMNAANPGLSGSPLPARNCGST